MRIPLAIGLMLALSPSAALAEGARTCMTPAEAEALVQYALPDSIGQLGTACTGILPATAFLIRNRADLVGRYTRAAQPALRAARTAFGKMVGIRAEQVANLRDETLRALLGTDIASAVGDTFKPRDCDMIDRVFGLIAPLPPENMAKLIGIAIREGNKPQKYGTAKPSVLSLCDGKEGV